MPKAKNLILVADDDVRMLRMMQRMMELEGYNVIPAADGNDALKIFHEKNPDLVLLDITMPGLAGFTVAKNFRETSRPPCSWRVIAWPPWFRGTWTSTSSRIS